MAERRSPKTCLPNRGRGAELRRFARTRDLLRRFALIRDRISPRRVPSGRAGPRRVLSERAYGSCA